MSYKYSILLIVTFFFALFSKGQGSSLDTCSVNKIFDKVSAEFSEELPVEISSSGIYFDSLNNRYLEVRRMKMRAAFLAMEEMSCTERYKYLRKNYFEVKSIYPDEIDLDFTIKEVSTKIWKRMDCYGETEAYEQVDSLQIYWTKNLNDSLRLKFRIVNDAKAALIHGVEIKCVESVSLAVEKFRSGTWLEERSMALDELELNCFEECFVVVEYDRKKSEAIILFKNSTEGSAYHTAYTLFRVFLADQKQNYEILSIMEIVDEM